MICYKYGDTPEGLAGICMSKDGHEEACKFVTRFGASVRDPHHTAILDMVNSEPICMVYHYYHPYAADMILKALNELFTAKDPATRKGD